MSPASVPLRHPRALSRVKEWLRRYRRAGITTLEAEVDGDVQHKVDRLAQVVDIVPAINEEDA